MREHQIGHLLVVLACLCGVASANAFDGWRAWWLGKRRIVVESYTDDKIARSDTLRPPDEWSRAFNAMVLPEESTEGRFLVSTEEYEDSTNTFWILDAKERAFHKLLETPLFHSSGAILWACNHCRIVISVGRDIMDQAPTALSITYLLDADTGAILREWKGLYLTNSSPAYLPRYDQETGSVWIMKTTFRKGSWQAEDAPQHLIRLDCTTGDTTWVSEQWLFGEDLRGYSVPDIYCGHMLVETGDGLSEKEKQAGFVRTMLFDIVNRKIEGEWRWEWNADIGPGYRLIAKDLSGFVHTETDSTGSIRWQKLWRVDEVIPVEVHWEGSRGP